MSLYYRWTARNMAALEKKLLFFKWQSETTKKLPFYEMAEWDNKYPRAKIFLSCVKTAVLSTETNLHLFWTDIHKLRITSTGKKNSKYLNVILLLRDYFPITVINFSKIDAHIFIFLVHISHNGKYNWRTWKNKLYITQYIPKTPAISLE